MEARLFFYEMKNLEPKIRIKVLTKLFGKRQKSNFGQYEYEIYGILPEDSYIKPVRAALIVKTRYARKISKLFDSFLIDYKIYEIKLKKNEFEK